MENIDILLEVKLELDRFNKKIEEAIIEQSDQSLYSSRKYAACKRSAQDLKIELNKLTQDSKYKYK